MSRSAYSKTVCRFCGGKSSNAGWARAAHENSKACRAHRGLPPLPPRKKRPKK